MKDVLEGSIGHYAGRGFLYIGVVGGVVSAIAVRFAQYALPPTHPLNKDYPEAFGWIPGLLLAGGPVMGCLYYLARKLIHLWCGRAKGTGA
jgi:hypothetical protein